MGWEQRGAYKYYYRKERQGSRVKSVYVGRGAIANMVSDLQTTSGALEKAIRMAYASEHEQMKQQDEAIEQTCVLVDSITKASLLAAGFHLHRRQWRKLRQ